MLAEENILGKMTQLWPNKQEQKCNLTKDSKDCREKHESVCNKARFLSGSCNFRVK